MDAVVTTVWPGEREVGRDQSCFIIAEAGVNHNGQLDLAKRLVAAAAEASADAVKFQTFSAHRVASASAKKAGYQKQTTAPEQSQREMLKRLELSSEAHRELQAFCHEKGVLFVSTPFDWGSVDLLDSIGVPFFKIGSGEITNHAFLSYVAGKGRPIVLSTGMSTLGEVDEAVHVIEQAGCREISLLHCVSNYPAAPADINLRAMQTLAAAWHYPVGYSDHTVGVEVALAAVAMGACIIEKHFTLDRDLPGPDHRASLEPDELRRMITGIRNVEAALGSGRKEPAHSESDTAVVARRSLVAARDIPAGRVLLPEDVAVLRPGTGLRPAMLPFVLGRRAKEEICEGTVLGMELLE